MNKCRCCKKETKNPYYCSHNCRYKYEQKEHPTRKGKYFICQKCGKKFYKSISNIDKNKYCSTKCYNKMRLIDKTKTSNYGNYKRKILKCKTCKTPFYVRPCEEKHNKQYCSQKCYIKAFNLNKTLHPNYRGGKYLICSFCKNKFYAYNYEKNKRKYCSLSCYLKDPKSPNRQFGKNNPMANPIYKDRARIGFLNHLKRTKTTGFKFNYGKKESRILNNIEKKFNIKIIRHYIIGGYVVDGYYKEKNTVIEIDEKYHKNEIIQKKDRTREKNIKRILDCKIIRIKDYEEINYGNVPIEV